MFLDSNCFSKKEKFEESNISYVSEGSLSMTFYSVDFEGSKSQY